MTQITIKEAFRMGEEAFLVGLPESAFLNQAFWVRANQINSHIAWKEVMRAYIEGWREAQRRAVR